MNSRIDNIRQRIIQFRTGGSKGPEPRLLEEAEFLLECVDRLKQQVAKERHYRHLAEREQGRIG